MSFDNVVPFSKQTDWVRKTLKLEYFCRGGTGGCIFEKVLENVIAETEFKLSPPFFYHWADLVFCISRHVTISVCRSC
jgi:hypothetical protein